MSVAVGNNPLPCFSVINPVFPAAAGRARVGRIERDGDHRAVRQLFERFYLFGVAGHREDKGIADRHQLIAVIFVLLFEERAVLEHVGVQFALVGSVVRQQ